MIAAALAFFAGKRWMFVAAIVLALLAGIGVQTVRLADAKTDAANTRTALANLQSSIAQERQVRAEQRATDEATARRTETQLVTQLTDTQRESDEKQAVLTDRVAALTRSLRNRPERPAPGSPVAPVASAATGNTGAGLYREDGEFLAGEAAAASRIVIERDRCYADYAAAREALSKGQVK